jgi:hypothetical protein
MYGRNKDGWNERETEAGDPRDPPGASRLRILDPITLIYQTCHLRIGLMIRVPRQF